MQLFLLKLRLQGCRFAVDHYRSFLFEELGAFVLSLLTFFGGGRQGVSGFKVQGCRAHTQTSSPEPEP